MLTSIKFLTQKFSRIHSRLNKYGVNPKIFRFVWPRRADIALSGRGGGTRSANAGRARPMKFGRPNASKETCWFFLGKITAFLILSKEKVFSSHLENFLNSLKQDQANGS